MRKRINQQCVFSTGDTPVVSKRQQMEEDHQKFIRWYKKFEEYCKDAPKVRTTTVVYNPTRHKFAIVFGEKIRINSESEFIQYKESNFKIVEK